MNKISNISVACVVSFALSSGVLAGAHGGMKRFEEADKDKNGTVTHEEMMAKVQEKFGEFDKNGDGFIELTELPKEMPIPERMQKRIEEHKKRLAKEGKELSDAKKKKWEKRKPTRIKFIAKMDKNGDEKVSVEEFGKKMVKHFKRADANGDGSVTREEAENAKYKRGKKDKHGMHGEYKDRQGQSM